jgi:hypothetical protein
MKINQKKKMKFELLINCICFNVECSLPFPDFEVTAALITTYRTKKKNKKK